MINSYNYLFFYNLCTMATFICQTTFNFLEKIFNCFIELDFMNRTTKRRILKKSKYVVS